MNRFIINLTLTNNFVFSGHINLGKKGYRVPQSGTIQATLFNPLGTVIKMFVVMYDLSDMPPNSQVTNQYIFDFNDAVFGKDILVSIISLKCKIYFLVDVYSPTNVLYANDRKYC